MTAEGADGLVYDDTFEAVAPLKDGRQIVIRPIRPTDKPLFVDGLRELSSASQYLRFFMPKPQFSDEELAYLTEIDGYNHVALGALRHSDPGAEGIGVARFIRFEAEPTVAEPAITVIDVEQANGVATSLLFHLYQAAQERGIRWFEADFLGENTGIRHLLKKWAPSASITPNGDGSLRVRLPVQPGGRVTPTEARHLLSLAATQRLAHRLK